MLSEKDLSYYPLLLTGCSDLPNVTIYIKRFENFVAFIVMKNALYPLKGISAKLQKRELDIYDAYMRIDYTISLLQAFREDVDTFHERVEAKQLAELIGSIEEKPRTVRAGMRQEHRSNVPAESISVYFKRSVMIPFLDYIISEMKTRFSKTNRQAVTCVLSLIPKEVMRRTPLPSEFEFYRDDLPSY